ncbi:TcfC E-set like domain-containing protein [Pragia fontium]|uniref:TcfC E-set like domain-containing protein n=1 Tax=Pragia fontium TaxID=82985 RepID=UPI000F705F7C|nr:TcfC E-set like domain-containing protein [Pragia fontium]VEJ53519.1 fimbrial outer membrane usher protein TcfC [Pragia fontium]
MNRKFNLNRLVNTIFVIFPMATWATESTAPISLPEGFDEVFNSELTGILDLIVADINVGTYAVSYNMGTVSIQDPATAASRILSGAVPNLSVTLNQLTNALSKPIPRVSKLGFPQASVTAYINENDARVVLVLPNNYLSVQASGNKENQFIDYQHGLGFVHSQNLNYFDDSYGSNFNLMSTDTLSLTGNSYLNGSWSISQGSNVIFDEAALYLEDELTRYKVGRQNITNNLTSSTPSMSYSFMNPVNFDGVSLGYLSDYYRDRNDGAASPVTLYMPTGGTVEIYRRGKLIDMQQMPGGLQTLNTDRWPTGGYDITIVSKLTNGSEERKTQPFYKRNGNFKSGRLEYLLQLGRYDGLMNDIINQCGDCLNEQTNNQVKNNNFGSAAVSYTTANAISLGSGVIRDDELTYGNASLDVPINSMFIERIYSDGIYGNAGSYAYSVAGSKSFDNTSFNVTYRKSVFNGDIPEYGRFGIIPAYDNEYLQLGMRTYLPWRLGFGVDYSRSTSYSNGGRENKGKQNTVDVLLNRDFQLSNDISLRVDAGYHTGKDAYNDEDSERDHQLYTQFTLGFTDSRYNHYQSLYLKARNSDRSGDDGTYSADYNLTVNNPEFDRGGRYNMYLTASDEVGVNKNAGGNLTVNNRFGYTSIGTNKSFNDSGYRQSFVSQRSGFAIGDGGIAYGSVTNQSALVVDATTLPEDQYFEVRNSNSSSVIVPGGKVTTISIQPYTQIDTKAEQVYTGNENSFYNVTAKNTSTHIMPGQSYKVTLNAMKNQTVTGRIYYAGKPLINARIVGSNGISDEAGFFIGDFIMDANDTLEQLKIRKGEEQFVCQIDQSKTKNLQGVIQLNGVECEQI